jgi:hypothetical protein
MKERMTEPSGRQYWLWLPGHYYDERNLKAEYIIMRSGLRGDNDEIEG